MDYISPLYVEYNLRVAFYTGMNFNLCASVIHRTVASPWCVWAVSGGCMEPKISAEKRFLRKKEKQPKHIPCIILTSVQFTAMMISN